MTSGIIALAAALAISVSTIFPAFGQGKAASAAMEAIARQPEAAGEIRSTLILSLGLMEALTIYGLLIAFMLVAKV
ncbi:MAG: ATP synthase F0 subunit C [Oscillospiraceae bacterium]|nr:ATP synthase F0 subunit C [Oscillospiraceae bacterium]MBR2807725.1 ATP synthase F0 subunit C [Oscillospiraceae bacterium]MBR3175651.1 ATP synthase F0 subunit C [Oscillospiraceae bacterium]